MEFLALLQGPSETMECGWVKFKIEGGSSAIIH